MRTKPIPEQILKQILSGKFQRRFWSGVKVGKSDECWPWLRSIASGYGQVNIRHGQIRYHKRAHCIAWISENKTIIPAGLGILHSCIGNKLCCNPAHLRLGTDLENVKDMDEQGRRVNGPPSGLCCENHPMAKFTNAQVLEIVRLKFECGLLQREIARRFSISEQQVSAIVLGKAWGQLTKLQDPHQSNQRNPYAGHEKDSVPEGHGTMIQLKIPLV